MPRCKIDIALMISETCSHCTCRSFYLVDANAPILRLTALPQAHRARGGDRLVVLPQTVAPRDIADRCAASDEDELLLPLVRLPQSPDLRVVLRADHQTHRLVARFAPRETVDLLRDLERRLAVPVFQLEGIGRTVDVDAAIATADRLGIKRRSGGDDGETEKTRTKRNIERRRTRRNDAALLHPPFTFVTINAFLVYHNCVVVETGSKYLAKHRVCPVDTTN